MIQLETLFEDDDIIVCIKPTGVLSQLDSKLGQSMVSILSENKNCKIYPIHRLDKDVGGVMVYTKTKSAAAFLSREIANNNFKKEYIALVHSTPKTKSGIMEDFLFKDSKSGKSFVVKSERKGVKYAKLCYEVLKTLYIEQKEYSLVKINLFTGRTHQIRVQFSSRQMSLAGDKKYGAKDSFTKIGLWSNKLEFKHPKTKETVSFSKPPQNYMLEYFE